MKAAEFDYVRPDSLAEACEALCAGILGEQTPVARRKLVACQLRRRWAGIEIVKPVQIHAMLQQGCVDSVRAADIDELDMLSAAAAPVGTDNLFEYRLGELRYHVLKGL